MTSDNRLIVGAFAICTFIGLIFFSFFDFCIYNLYKDNYVKTQVEITSVSADGGGNTWTHKANFEVNIDGIVYESSVNSNFWEHQGDIIEVAYNSDYQFIRPQIYLGLNVIELLLLFIIFVIGFIWGSFHKAD